MQNVSYSISEDIDLAALEMHGLFEVMWTANNNIKIKSSNASQQEHAD